MCLMQVFMDRFNPLLQANCPDDMGCWSDDHLGTVLIKRKAREAIKINPTVNHQPRSGVRPAQLILYPCDHQTGDHSSMSSGQSASKSGSEWSKKACIKHIQDSERCCTFEYVNNDIVRQQLTRCHLQHVQ